MCHYSRGQRLSLDELRTSRANKVQNAECGQDYLLEEVFGFISLDAR